MHPKAIALFTIVRELHSEGYRLVKELAEDTRNERDAKELVDINYAVKQCLKWCEDMVTELNRIETTSSLMAGGLWVQEGTGEPIRTEYCTATPKADMSLSIPSRTMKRDEYLKLCDYFKLQPEFNVLDEEIFRFYWPGLMTYCEKLAENGLPLPPGLDLAKQWPRFSLRTRGRKGVDS